MFEPDPFPGLYFVNLIMNYISTEIYRTTNKLQMNSVIMEEYNRDEDVDDPRAKKRHRPSDTSHKNTKDSKKTT